VCGEVCRAFNDEAQDDKSLSCEDLEKYAKEFSIADPAGPWNLLAICTAPKGIVAVLTLSMISSLMGVMFCFCCRTRPKLLLIPAIISAVLAAIGPIGYGGAVASQYPWNALEMDEMLSLSLGGASAAASDVATVRSGFAVAIVASVTSFIGAMMLVYNLYFVRATSANHGRELEVMSAVPVPVTDVLAARGEQVSNDTAQDGQERVTAQDAPATASDSALSMSSSPPAPTAPSGTSMNV